MPKTSRYNCKTDEFEHCWLEVKDAWSMKEVRELVAANDDESYFKIFNEKVVSMHITDMKGNIYTDPKSLDSDTLEGFDVEMAGFLGGVLPLHVERRRQLGKWSVTLLSDGSDEKN